MNRIMATLWLPLDNFNSCSSSPKSFICPCIPWMVTFYSYNLISLVLEHHAQLGCRYLRFRDMARDILGMNTFFPTLALLIVKYHYTDNTKRLHSRYVTPIFNFNVLIFEKD